MSGLVNNYIGNSVAQRDYVSRGRSSKSQHKKSQHRISKKKNRSQLSPLLLSLAIVLLLLFIGGLWFISHHKTAYTVDETVQKKKGGFSLPSKPNEYWTYIDKLENRQSGSPQTTLPDSSAQATVHPPLTQEQKQLLEQMSADMRNQPIQLNEVPWNQQNTVQNKNQKTPVLAPKTSRFSNNQQPKKVAKLASTDIPNLSLNHPAETNTSQQAASKKRLVQCGAFKAAAQAEPIRAQLAFKGYESRLTSRNGWYKVVIGPFENPTQTAEVIKRLSHSNHLNCIAIGFRG